MPHPDASDEYHLRRSLLIAVQNADIGLLPVILIC